MKIVIDIPNWLYHAIMEHSEPVYSQSLGDAVRDGIPLPKGHGRLIDADELKKHKYHDNDRFENAVAVAQIDWLDTIIEADKAESEDKLDGDPIDIDKAVEHYERTLETLKGIDLEVDG